MAPCKPLNKRKEEPLIKKVAMTIILLALSLALITGVIVPFADAGRETGKKAHDTGKDIGNKIVDVLK